MRITRKVRRRRVVGRPNRRGRQSRCCHRRRDCKNEPTPSTSHLVIPPRRTTPSHPTMASPTVAFESAFACVNDYIRSVTAPLPSAPIHDRLGITIQSAALDRVVGTMPVEGNQQPFGALHGGASVVLAESLGSIGTALHASGQATVAGVDVNATHHRVVRSGVVTGTATPLHVGRTLATWAVEIVNDQGQRTCTARITCAIRPSDATGSTSS